MGETSTFFFPNLRDARTGRLVSTTIPMDETLEGRLIASVEWEHSARQMAKKTLALIRSKE